MKGALGCAVVSKQDLITSGTRSDEKKGKIKSDNDGGSGTGFNCRAHPQASHHSVRIAHDDRADKGQYQAGTI